MDKESGFIWCCENGHNVLSLMYRRFHNLNRIAVKNGLDRAAENGHSRLVEMHNELF